MTLAGMGVIYKRLRNEEQRELGFAAFQQPSMTSALVAAITDILLIDIAVAGLQFADKGAFRYPAGTQQPVFTHIVREYRKQQRVFPEAPECRATLYKVSPQQRVGLRFRQIAGELLTGKEFMAVTYTRVVPGIVPSLKALYAGHSPVKERSRYHQSVRWRLPATLCRHPGITETDGQDNQNHSYYHRHTLLFRFHSRHHRTDDYRIHWKAYSGDETVAIVTSVTVVIILILVIERKREYARLVVVVLEIKVYPLLVGTLRSVIKAEHLAVKRVTVVGSQHHAVIHSQSAFTVRLEIAHGVSGIRETPLPFEPATDFGCLALYQTCRHGHGLHRKRISAVHIYVILA